MKEIDDHSKVFLEMALLVSIFLASPVLSQDNQRGYVLKELQSATVELLA